MVSINALAPHKESDEKIKVVSSVEEIAEDIKKDLPQEKKEPEKTEEPEEPEEPKNPEEPEEPKEPERE